MLIDSVSPYTRIKRRLGGKCAVTGTTNLMFVYADAIAKLKKVKWGDVVTASSLRVP